ncbi:MAG: hypothetical protein AAGC44_04275 [Planctomycetota bacterium]
MFISNFAASERPAPNPNDPKALTDEDELLEEDEDSVGDEINATLAALMPWCISFLFHAVLVVVALIFVWQVINPGEEEQDTIPTAKLSDTIAPPATLTPDVEKTDDTAPTNLTPDPQLEPQPVEAETLDTSSLVGAGAISGGPAGGPLSFDNGDGLSTNMFGSPGGSNVTRIAFVIDASGSMVDILPFVINELKRVVNDLKSVQNFTVIFFSGEGVFEVPGGGKSRGLRSATPAFKQATREWVTLDNHEFPTGGRGSAHAIEAIEQALRSTIGGNGPQLIYLLSDNLTGGGQGATQYEIFQDELMARLEAANKDVGAKFNTLQFLYEDPLVRAGKVGTMKLIAESTGGDPTFIDERRLGLR